MHVRIRTRIGIVCVLSSICSSSADLHPFLMTFSSELENRFAKLLNSYPPGRQRSAVIPMLLYAQDEIGSVTPELIEEVARRTGVTPLQVDEVVGYYSMLHKKPLGKYHVQICTNISCLLRGGMELWEHAA
jgi:NADH-quinone oxidoreductase subunit E